MDDCIFHIDYLDLGIGLNMFFAYKSKGKEYIIQYMIAEKCSGSGCPC